MIFTGTYENKLDQKGRVSLPADFRDVLCEEENNRVFFLFPSPHLPCVEGCGVLFVKKIIKNIEEKSEMFSQEEYQMSAILSEIKRIQYDETGRIVLPKPFAQHAHLKNSVIFMGIGTRFQIWDPELHNNNKQKALGLYGGKN